MNKKLVALATRIITGATLILGIAPATAAGVDVNIGFPGVVVQQRPVYIQPQYEIDWRERQVRAMEWRDNPKNHGRVVKASAHGHKMDKKNKHQKHHGKSKHDH